MENAILSVAESAIIANHVILSYLLWPCGKVNFKIITLTGESAKICTALCTVFTVVHEDERKTIICWNTHRVRTRDHGLLNITRDTHAQ